MGRFWFAWRGWQWPVRFRIGETRIFSVGPVAVFVHRPDSGGGDGS